MTLGAWGSWGQSDTAWYLLTLRQCSPNIGATIDLDKRKCNCVMADEEIKKRTFRCTDEEWQKIVEQAEKNGISANQYLIGRVNDDYDNSNKFEKLADDISRILAGTRLLSYDLIDRLNETHSPEEIEHLIKRSKGAYKQMKLEEEDD